LEPALSEYQPFIDDPDDLALLEGQRYVVLRPAGAVAAVYADVANAVRERAAGLPLSFPARPHVTLGGFPAGTSLNELQQLVERWASLVPPLQVVVDGIGFFPFPFQVVIIQIQRIPELSEALTSLRRNAGGNGLAAFDDIPVKDWTFHMSVAYGRRLGSDEWAELKANVERLTPPPEGCLLDTVELVAFDDGREYSGGVYRLSATTKAI
jgi:2'-5' RNA ligase